MRERPEGARDTTGRPFLVPLQRGAIGAVLGALSWLALSRLFPLIPPPARFLIAWLFFTFGPGAAAGLAFTRHLDSLRRAIVLLAIGSALTPVLVVLLGYAHALPWYPYIVLALGGAALALWNAGPAISGADLRACAGLCAIATITGAIVFWHRLSTTAGVKVFGLYDSMDLSFYAVMAADATHTIPPQAAYYSGHGLFAAYYPQLILTMVHRFTDVPLLQIYFGYAWPTFLGLAALTGFVLVRSLASTGVAFLAMVLMLVGGDFSYLAATMLPHATLDWDFLLWPTNFLSPTMEVLHFSTWAPTLPVLFGVLFGIGQALRTRSRGWIVLTAALLATLFQFKPFAYMVVVAGLSGAAVFAGRDWSTRVRVGAILTTTVVFTLPFVYTIATQPDRRSRFLIQVFMLPQRMLLKLDLASWADAVAARIAPAVFLRRPVVFAIATIIFFAGGLGIRWLGLPGVWRAIRRRAGEDVTAWSVLGWTSAAGIVIPFVLVTDPYVDTLQFYQTSLYVLWIFTAAALVAFARRRRVVGGVAIAVAIAVSLPSSMHFLHVKWTDAVREPRAALSRSEVAISNYLRSSTDPESTVVLHDRPAQPSLLAIVSERRVVLGWGHPYYAVGSGGRLNDVNAFFDSAAGDPSAALDTLRRYHVTHVVVADRDHVHTAVLEKLRVLLRYPDATLYAVPATMPAS